MPRSRLVLVHLIFLLLSPRKDPVKFDQSHWFKEIGAALQQVTELSSAMSIFVQFKIQTFVPKQNSMFKTTT